MHAHLNQSISQGPQQVRYVTPQPIQQSHQTVIVLQQPNPIINQQPIYQQQQQLQSLSISKSKKEDNSDKETIKKKVFDKHVTILIIFLLLYSLMTIYPEYTLEYHRSFAVGNILSGISISIILLSCLLYLAIPNIRKMTGYLFVFSGTLYFIACILLGIFLRETIYNQNKMPGNIKPEQLISNTTMPISTINNNINSLQSTLASSPIQQPSPIITSTQLSYSLP